MLPDPVFDFHVVGMGLFGESCSRGLFGGEEPLLRLRYFVEPSCCFFVWSRHSTIPLLSWGIMHHAPALGNSQSCRANLMKTKEIHYPTSVCSVALCMIRARRTLISKVVECFSPSLLKDGHLVPKEKEGVGAQNTQ